MPRNDPLRPTHVRPNNNTDKNKCIVIDGLYETSLVPQYRNCQPSSYPRFLVKYRAVDIIKTGLNTNTTALFSKVGKCRIIINLLMPTGT